MPDAGTLKTSEVGFFWQDIAVHKAYLSLGSNIGDRAANIGRAIAELGKRGLRITRRSSLYETEPVEFVDQPWFLNSAIEVKTDLRAAELLNVVLEVEQAMRRERRVPKGPRVIDIDILLFDDDVIHTAELDVPHPRIAERLFVLIPMNEIAPEAVHPTLKKNMAQLLAETDDSSEVRRVSD